MKKILVFLTFILFSTQVYPFWIWSPKLKKWKNPSYSPLPTPQLQLNAAIKEFEANRFKPAIKEFKKILIHYPDSQEASEAQYYLGRCWEELKKPYQAFLAYQKVIDTYPNSKRIQEIIEREYNIGEHFLNREPKKWLGISWYDLTEHPSMEIFRRIVENAPHSEYAPRAQYKLGILLFKLNRFEEAREAFGKLLDDYPESDWVEAAKYQLALSSAQISLGPDYDGTLRKEAMDKFGEFLEKHPQSQISQQAEANFKALREEEAKRNFNIAQFYQKQNKLESAIIYYEFVVNNFSDTEFAKKAQAQLKNIKR
jgi:outer membrane protein assembly factor BamD (BamD/ComL family)